MPERNAAGPGSGLAGKRPAKDALGRRSKTMEAEASSSEDVRGGEGEGSRERGKDAGERRRAEGRGVGDSVEGSKGPWKMVKNHGGAKRTLEKRWKNQGWSDACFILIVRAQPQHDGPGHQPGRQTDPPQTRRRGGTVPEWHRGSSLGQSVAKMQCSSTHPSRSGAHETCA